MNIQTAMKIAPAKINDLFAKLAETTNGAVKTRETLFAALETELHGMVELEESHLLPLLAKHAETKALVPAAREDNKAILAQVKALGQVPKSEDAFVQGLADLRKSFQQSVRDDRKELLPAIQTVLGRDEAEQVAGKLETGIAEAEQARKDEQARVKADAKAAGEQAQKEVAAGQAVERTRDATAQAGRETARVAATVFKEASNATSQATRQMATRFSDEARRATTSFSDATGIYWVAASRAAEDLQAVASASSDAAKGLAEVRQLLTEGASTAIQDGVTLSQRLLRCRNGRDIAEAQRDYLTNATRGWLASQVKVLEATQRMTAAALPALQARLTADPAHGQSDRTGR